MSVCVCVCMCMCVCVYVQVCNREYLQKESNLPLYASLGSFELYMLNRHILRMEKKEMKEKEERTIGRKKEKEKKEIKKREK